MRTSSIISCVIIIGLGACLVLQHRSLSKLGAENRTLRERLDHFDRLSAENQGLSKRLAQADEAAASSAEQLNELLRLRAEVGALRNKTQKQHPPRPTPAAAANPPAAPKSVQAVERRAIPKESLQFVGYATPEAALQSVVWSMVNGDLASFLAGMTPEGRDSFTQQVDGKTDAEIATIFAEETRGMRGLRLDRKKSASDTEVTFVISSQETDDGATISRDEAVMKFKNLGGEWKYAP